MLVVVVVGQLVKVMDKVQAVVVVPVQELVVASAQVLVLVLTSVQESDRLNTGVFACLYWIPKGITVHLVLMVVWHSRGLSGRLALNQEGRFPLVYADYSRAFVPWCPSAFDQCTRTVGMRSLEA